MDTQTGKITNLSEKEAEEAQRLWALWEAGLLEEQPRYAPINRDIIAPHRRRKRRRKAYRSYKDYCR